MKKQYKKNNIVQVRDDFFIPLNRIDVIEKTNKVPNSDNKYYDEERYIIWFVSGSHYNWISLTEKTYNKYLKKYINI